MNTPRRIPNLLPALLISTTALYTTTTHLLACAPDTPPPPNPQTTSSSTSSSSTTSTGSLFDSGPTCDDPTDSDADFIADTLETPQKPAPLDTDNDGTPDTLDTDSDNDGTPDTDEAQNPLLPLGIAGQTRDDPCDPIADTDTDGTPDIRDNDSDNDGVSDLTETALDPGNLHHCRVLPDCDNDGVIDVIELAAGTNPKDPKSIPEDPGLYFVLPYQAPEQTKEFTFSTGVSKADLYFLIDTTASMQPSIDALKTSLSSTILPTILNGDPNANPPIAPISEAWIGIGEVRDVPWGAYGQPGDNIYKNRFTINGNTIAGTVGAPIQNGPLYEPPNNVQTILAALSAAGGGDGPEATTQALWIASTNMPYAATGMGLWKPQDPYPAACAQPGMFGVPCFRPDALSVFILITDAPFHNGPAQVNNYNPMIAGGTKTYAETKNALANISAKIVGVPVASGNPGAARADLTDLAQQTGSLYFDPAFGGLKRPLVPQSDVAAGEIQKEVVRLLGLLVGAGLHDVTTAKQNYDCPGSTDCNADGTPDPEYHNAELMPGQGPFDASSLVLKVEAVPEIQTPMPYGSINESTFFDVRGNAKLRFRVHAKNDVWKPSVLTVLTAAIRVQTQNGQKLGGKDGFRFVYFVLPEFIETTN